MDASMENIRTPTVLNASGLAQNGPSLGDLMKVREMATSAIEVARERLSVLYGRAKRLQYGNPDASQVAAEAKLVSVELERLFQNAEGYLSDWQGDTIVHLIADAKERISEAKEADSGIYSVDEFIARDFVYPLTKAVDAVDLEIVNLEADEIPVRERQSSKVAEAVTIVVVLGLIAWAVS